MDEAGAVGSWCSPSRWAAEDSVAVGLVAVGLVASVAVVDSLAVALEGGSK